MATNLVNGIANLLNRDIEKLKEEINAYGDENKLWQVSGSVANSAGTLCLHLTGSLNHFIGAVLGKTGFVRDRESEFSLRNVPKAKMLADLEQTRKTVADTLAGLQDEDLHKTFPVKFQGEDVQTFWFLSHILTHVSYHLGQVNYHRRMN